MRYCRFENNGNAAFGLVETVAGREEITAVLESPERHPNLHPKSIPGLALIEAKLLAPVQPSKIVCVGRNYREHAAELGNEVPAEPVIFLKPPSSLLASGQNIRRPKLSERVDYEGELGVVIGKRCYKLSDEQEARSFILGYTCVNDVTA